MSNAKIHFPKFTAAKHYRNAHVQTLLPRFLRRQVRFSPYWQTLLLPDGDFIDLAWSKNPIHVSASTPIFILFHGLEGSFYSPYANGLMSVFAQQGWLAVMMHFRGCSGRANNHARAYHSGEIEDPRHFIETIAEQFPHNPKAVVGVSLGGNMLGNYLSHYAEDPLVDHAAIVSAPFELSSCSDRINKGFSKVYQQYLLSSLKRNTLNKLSLLNQHLPISVNKIKQIKTLREFDDCLTAPLHQFKDADDYYRQCSALSRIKNISVPTLIIHAKDDPFMDQKVILDQPLPRHINYCLTEHGGHVGFVEKHQGHFNLWLERSLPLYFGQYFNHSDAQIG